MILSLFLGILVGIILGLTGAGGGILAVPALVAGMGWSVPQAAPVALIAVVGSALLGAIGGLRRKLVRYRAAMVIAAAGIPCTSLGIGLAGALPQAWLMALFGLVMLVVAWRLVESRRQQTETLLSAHFVKDWEMGKLDPDTGRFCWNPATTGLMVSIGAITGLMTGMLGVGGGFFIVPMLRRFTALTMYSIVPTSLLIISLVGSGSIAMALLHGAEMPVTSTSLFALTTAIGMLLGRQLTSHLSDSMIQRSFALVLLLVASGLEVRAIIDIVDI